MAGTSTPGLDRRAAVRAVGAASPRALQELAETAQRSHLGGPFYLLAWLFAAMAAELPERAPAVFALVGLAFLLLSIARLRARPLPAGADASAVARRLDRIWLVVLVNAAAWGAASGWLLWNTADDAARTVTAVCSYAFSTALAHNFCMRHRRAQAAIAMLYLPAMAAYVASGSRIEFVAIGAFYLAYVLLALRRSHGEYLQRLDLEDELRAQRDRFEQQSQRDGLTGLANRRQFTAVLDRWVAEQRSEPLPFALLVLDLDWFKTVNDRHGHAVGDASLRAFAELLQQAFPTADELVARLGGEEFAVLIRDCGVAAATGRAEAFRQAVATRPLSIDGIELGMTVSIGVGGFEPLGHRDGDALFNAVDAALYRAKAGGRNAVRRVAAAA
jgi:diguanylate cyclase